MQQIHFIGICGVGMSGLAIAMKEQGWQVTGSDKGFYPPVSTQLEKAGISFYPGWHVEKMIAEGVPDLVVVGNVAGSENPEWQYVREQKIPYVSYPELIAKYFIKKNSIVCAGTYGKTTSTALLTWILTQAGFDPSYMFGGIYADVSPKHHVETHCNASLQSSTPSAKITNSNWSILEGDEYKTARWDNRPKFASYSPTHVLLTSIVWDHADVYPTPNEYEKVFVELVQSVPKDGIIVACTDDPTIDKIVTSSNCKIIKYGKKSEGDYIYSDVQASKNGTKFTLTARQFENPISVSCPLLGDFSAANITGCFALAHHIGIAEEKIVEAIETFPGIKRRLECRFRGNVDVYDDIAHSPAKAKAVLKSLKDLYSGKIIAIFEPNTGNREYAALPGYDNAFSNADILLIPRLTKLKMSSDHTKTVDGKDLATAIAKTHANVQYIDDDEKLAQTILDTAKLGDAVIFLGSHGFRGMIEKIIYEITSSSETRL